MVARLHATSKDRFKCPSTQESTNLFQPSVPHKLSLVKAFLWFTVIQNWREIWNEFRQMEVSFTFSHPRSRQPEGKPTPPLMEAPLLPAHSPREGAGPNVAGRWMTIKAHQGHRWQEGQLRRQGNLIHRCISNLMWHVAYCATSHEQHDVSHKSAVSFFGLKDWHPSQSWHHYDKNLLF